MEQPNWLDLPIDLLEPIAQRSRDAITGVTLFRSVCRTWRAAVRQAPRLLLRPSPQNAGAEHTLIFPLSHGWLIVVDARDASCRLLHLATGATAALPKITAVRNGNDATYEITHVGYDHYTDEIRALVTCGFLDVKIKIYGSTKNLFFGTYIDFSDFFCFAIHVPAGAPAASTEGMMITMFHWMHLKSEIILCRPGDAAWTKIARPTLTGFVTGLAYMEDKIFTLKLMKDRFFVEAFDATMLELLHQAVDVPQATAQQRQHPRHDPNETEYFSLVTVPSKILLVRVTTISFEPKAFTVFELIMPRSSDGALSWCEVTGNVDDGIGGNYDLYVDRYHATFSGSGAGSGTRIYYVLGRFWDVYGKIWNHTISAYCYDMNNSKIECVYRSPEDGYEYSTQPGWFHPWVDTVDCAYSLRARLERGNFF